MSSHSCTGEDGYVPSAILLTGGCGFIGSHVACHLVSQFDSCRVVVLDVMNYASSARNLAGMGDKVTVIRGDVRSADLVRHIIKFYEIDTVMHFAAQTHVDNSFANSVTFTNNNVLGTHILLEVVREAMGRVKRFIHVSTDEVYGENSTVDQNHSEGMVLEPTNPYAASKAAAEFIAKSYKRSFGVPVIITRGNNVYGPRQYPEKLVPKTILRFLHGMPACIHGNGKNSRTFMHVDDVARAFVTILRRGDPGETYNIGVSADRTNLSVVRDIAREMDMLKPDQSNIGDILEFVEDRKYNDQRYLIDTRKLENLGWEAQVSWEDGLHGTIDWYQNNMDYWGEHNVLEALRPHPVVHHDPCDS